MLVWCTQLHVKIQTDNVNEVILDTRNLDVQSITDQAGQALSFDIATEHKVGCLQHINYLQLLCVLTRLTVLCSTCNAITSPELP